MRLSTESLARASARHPWRTVGIWIVVVVLSFGAVATLLGVSSVADGTSVAETEAEVFLASHRLAQARIMFVCVAVAGADFAAHGVVV